MPAGRVLVVNVTVPEETVLVLSVVLPSKNFTVPLGLASSAGRVTVNVSEAPAVIIGADAVRVMVAPACDTGSDCAVDVTVVKFASPE